MGTMDKLRTAVVVTAALLILTGCTRSSRPDPGPTGSTPPVRTDRDPIAQRFPQLGDFTQVHWQGGTAGTDSGRVPGPTDVRIQALVVVRPETVAVATTQYTWATAPSSWDSELSAPLRAYAPHNATWKVSDHFTKAVLPSGYGGTVFLDAASGTVYLNAFGH
jgi:hypothetical protein